MQSPMRLVLTALAVLTMATSAGANEIQQCIDDSERGQSARDTGKLLDARASFARCASARCPQPVASDCARWFDEVGHELPRIVIAVVDENGADLIERRIAVDDLPGGPTDGRALELDPGTHRVRVERPGRDDLVVPFVARVGEKDRIVRVIVESSRAPLPPAPAAKRSIPALSIGLGIVGLAALGTSATFAVLTERKYEDLDRGCRPFCARDDISSVKTTAMITDVALGLGVVAIAVAAGVFLFGRPDPHPARVGTR